MLATAVPTKPRFALETEILRLSRGSRTPRPRRNARAPWRFGRRRPGFRACPRPAARVVAPAEGALVHRQARARGPALAPTATGVAPAGQPGQDRRVGAAAPVAQQRVRQGGPDPPQDPPEAHGFPVVPPRRAAPQLLPQPPQPRVRRRRAGDHRRRCHGSPHPVPGLGRIARRARRAAGRIVRRTAAPASAPALARPRRPRGRRGGSGI